MRKIALVITDLNMAGAQKYVVDLMPFIAKRFPDSCMIILGVAKGTELERVAEQKGIRTLYMKERSGNFLKRKWDTWTFLCKTLRNEKADILFVHLDYMYTWIYSAVYSKKIIETIHTQPYRIHTRWISYMYRLLSKRQLISPILLTESGAKEFTSIFKEEKKVDVIPNAIDIGNYSVQRSKCDFVRLSFVARFHEIKNHSFLLKAFKLALNSEPNLILSLAGEGELLEDTKKLAAQLGIQDNVKFLGNVNDIPELLRDTDIFTISSISESFSLVLIEAMAAGLPIIATNVGGMRDIIKDNGFLIDPMNVEEFANAIILLAHDIAMRKKMGEMSRALAEEYSIDRIADKYIEIFENECEGK